MQPDLYMNPDKSFTSEYPCRGLLDNHRHPGDVIRIQEIDRITGEIERAVKKVPGVSSALAERLNGGRYIDVNIDRDAAPAMA